jgi:hypothetical protein
VWDQHSCEVLAHGLLDKFSRHLFYTEDASSRKETR